MNNYVESFYSFFPNDGSINLNELFSLNENGSSVKYTKKEFKNLFSGAIFESNLQNDELEKAYSYYEMYMLYEAKSNLINSPGKFTYLDADTHIILIKNGEGFVIEKETFDIANNINEWGISWEDIENGWNKVKSVAKASIKKSVSIVKDGWDKLSYGAKKAWEFVKTCSNLVAEFVTGMTWLEWAALSMSVISAILGICGAAVTATGVLAPAGPILTGLAGIFQAIGGGIHLYEGNQKIKAGQKILEKNQTIDPSSKMIASITQALPEYLIGAGMIFLGVYDVTKAGTALIDPSSGSQSVVIGTSVKSSLQSVVKEVSKTGGAIHHFIEHSGIALLKKSGISVASKAGKEAVGKILTAIISTVSSSILSSIFGWMWEFILNAGNSIIKGFDYLIKIPEKISNAINDFTEKSNSTFTKIISNGLKKIVKPITDTGASVISKYIQPTVDKIKSWFTNEIKYYKDSLEDLKEYKHELHTGIKHHEVKKPDKKSSSNPVSPKHKIDDKKVNKKDIKIINKSINKNKTNESLFFEMGYLKKFSSKDW